MLFDKMQALQEIYGNYGVETITAWVKLYRMYLFDDVRFPVGKVHQDEFVAHKLLYNATKFVFTTRKL